MVERCFLKVDIEYDLVMLKQDMKRNKELYDYYHILINTIYEMKTGVTLDHTKFEAIKGFGDYEPLALDCTRIVKEVFDKHPTLRDEKQCEKDLFYYLDRALCLGDEKRRGRVKVLVRQLVLIKGSYLK